MINSSAVREELQNELSTFINNLSDHRQETICGSYSAGEDSCLIGVHLQEDFYYSRWQKRFTPCKGREMIHHASLIVDDQIDKAHTKEGRHSGLNTAQRSVYYFLT